ncbi:CRISPR-associated helicase Cas3' [Chitinophaga sp. HK235]|uniref:CRISPR-associated helicase Cas3' n=1 Tax=Chitinophaga sp. HK235 TaxID=2952571 RepID=UPI001BA7E89A|nr:CRISPR-associated helicase Cas3' [Chitinophaga sp. HK235]
MPKTIKEILDSAPNTATILENAPLYWAHIHPTHREELLATHILLVNHYCKKLVIAHGLEKIIDNLILDIVKDWESSAIAGDLLKQLFVHIIVFHDYGKVNELFQVKRMKNKHFSPNHETVMDPPHGHSLLSTFIYLCYQFNQIKELEIPQQTKDNLFYCALQLGISILRHHSSILPDTAPDDPRGYRQIRNIFSSLTKYLDQYTLQTNGHQFKKDLEEILLKWKSTATKVGSGNPYRLFALVKLNFSLLTASDYMATHEYMNSSQEGKEAATTAFGVFDERDRLAEIIKDFRQFGYNAKTFSSEASPPFIFPEEKSNDNLNKLRQQMAQEVLSTLKDHWDKRLFYLEAPTGGGKTNLSAITFTTLLEWNPELNKVIYVFPFTTLITQTHQFLKKSLGLKEHEIIAIHSKAEFQSGSQQNDKEGLYGDEYKDYINNLFALYPLTLLSHVSFFDILKTNRKESNYLLHRLANSIVIIDEIQSYTPDIWDKMLYFISQYATYFNIRFVLMSATLPKISSLRVGLETQTDFVDLLPNARKYITNPNFADRVRFNFELLNKVSTLPDLAAAVIEKSGLYIQQNGSVKTIIEFIFKKSAADFLREISTMDHPFDIILILSGTVLDPRRREIINFIKRSAKTKINILLITTQVVEAGVDIDMDLGFKNTSLLDSDEQLAGRVNRNAMKGCCEVYLFNKDNAGLLHSSDIRYRQTKEKINHDTYQRILKEKDFRYLYEEVLEFIDESNNHGYIDDLDAYKFYLSHLHFIKANEKFKIIDQHNISVFVPLKIPISIEGEEAGKEEEIFSSGEISFLKQFEVYPDNNMMDGSAVWGVYELLVQQKKTLKNFDISILKNFKILQSILSKFTFSLIYHANQHKNILNGFGIEKLGYTYLTHWDDERAEGKIYEYDHGLNSKAFSDANFI